MISNIYTTIEPPYFLPASSLMWDKAYTVDIILLRKMKIVIILLLTVMAKAVIDYVLP